VFIILIAASLEPFESVVADAVLFETELISSVSQTLCHINKGKT
jgi:hypothetical protein